MFSHFPTHPTSVAWMRGRKEDETGERKNLLGLLQENLCNLLNPLLSLPSDNQLRMVTFSLHIFVKWRLIQDTFYLWSDFESKRANDFLETERPCECWTVAMPCTWEVLLSQRLNIPWRVRERVIFVIVHWFVGKRGQREPSGEVGTERRW